MSNDALVMALFAAYATFTAFGAAIAGFVAAGGAVQALTSWWTRHGEDEHSDSGNSASGLLDKLTLRWLSANVAIVLITLIILAVIIISGVGLVLCFIWLNAYSHGLTAGKPGVYDWILGLFWAEASMLTVATCAAVLAAAGSALTALKSPDKERSQAGKARAEAESQADLDAALRDAALGWLDDPD